ncbi:MAG: hypothetical protein ACFFEN_07985 [Candidatus Thorarchaeota archaeon]
MTKNPLVIQYVENKKDHTRVGKVFYVEGKKREKFVLDLENSVKVLDDEEQIRNTINSLINKNSHKIKSCYFIHEWKAFSLNKKFRELDFSPKYRELVIRQQKGISSEMVVVDYVGKLKFFNSFDVIITNEMTIIDTSRTNLFNSRFAKKTRRDLEALDKELIREFKEDKIKSEENIDDKVIMLDYNTVSNDLFKKVCTFVYHHIPPFIYIEDDTNKRYDQEHSQYWKEKLNDLHRIKRIKTYGSDKYIYQDFITKYPTKIPRRISEWVLKSKFKRDVNKINEKKLVDYLTKEYFRTLICGDIDFNYYPNQKITVYHALDIDCDLMNTFNICMKDLEPLSFQFIDVNYSNDGIIGEIKLEGPINLNKIF